MNEYRPTLPWSADSSRNDGPDSRSFKNADTGVWQSSMNVSRTGTRLCSRASSRTSSSDGIAASALTTAIQHPLGIGEREPTLPQQHRQVIEHVGRLLGDALIGLG